MGSSRKIVKTKLPGPPMFQSSCYLEEHLTNIRMTEHESVTELEVSAGEKEQSVNTAHPRTALDTDWV